MTSLKRMEKGDNEPLVRHCLEQAPPCGCWCALGGRSLWPFRPGKKLRAGEVRMSQEPGLAAGTAAEVLRKLPDCINEVPLPGYNLISLEDGFPEGLLHTRGKSQDNQARQEEGGKSLALDPGQEAGGDAPWGLWVVQGHQQCWSPDSRRQPLPVIVCGHLAGKTQLAFLRLVKLRCGRRASTQFHK